jgi:hypothetical protein
MMCYYKITLPGFLPSSPCLLLSRSKNNIRADGAAALSTSLAGLTSMQMLNIRCLRPTPPYSLLRGQLPLALPTTGAIGPMRLCLCDLGRVRRVLCDLMCVRAHVRAHAADPF